MIGRDLRKNKTLFLVNNSGVGVGKLCLPAPCFSHLHKNMDGATLHINGGRIVNADIVIKNGGSIIISNDALIEIREQGGNLNLENGAILNYIKGTIQ